MLKLLKSRICTPSLHLCFNHIACYAHETSDANLTHICDPDFNIFY